MSVVKRIGYWVWNIKNPASRQFQQTPLTEADRKYGYRSQRVYVREGEDDDDSLTRYATPSIQDRPY